MYHQVSLAAAHIARRGKAMIYQCGSQTLSIWVMIGGDTPSSRQHDQPRTIGQLGQAMPSWHRAQL